MGSATGMNQLFRNLCHHTMWKYAILWRFQHENRSILTCEDSYAIDTKSGTAMEYASYEEFVSRHPWGSNIQSGNSPSCSIIVAVSNMMRISYLLGEGIVGKVASMENHLWICIEEMNTDLLLECREELRLQVVAGIKTILLLPVLPLGLVQLGSLDKLSEDLAMVAQLKDLFYPYQYASVSGLRMEQTDSSMTLNMSSLEKYSTCLEINTKLIDPIQSQPLPIPDFTTVSFDQMMMNELLPIGSVLLPHPIPQSYDPFSQVGLRQAHGLGTDLLDEISLSAMCNELFGDHSEQQFTLNTPTFTEGTKESDQTISLHDNEVKTIPVIGHRLGSKNTFMFDPCDYNKAHLTFVEEFDLIIESTTNSKYMDFSIETGPHRAMEHNFLVDCKNSEGMDNKSKADERSERIATFKEEMPEQELESCDCANGTGYLPCVGGGKKLESCDCSKSHCCSTGRCADSCLTQCKAEDVSNSEDSSLQSCKLSSLVSDSKGFKSCFSTCQSSGSVHTVPKNVDKKDNVSGFKRSFLKESHISHRQTKMKDSSKPRPRDRQLIQDRIMELRELIPNSSKCSVDALLQRTVNHMMFLQSIPIHASKLGQSTRTKVVQAAKKFQCGGISPELEEKLNTMFSQVVATGEDSWAPSIGNLSPDVGRIQLEDNDVENIMENNQGGPEEIGGHSTTIGNASTSASKRRKIGKNKGLTFSLMSDLHQSTLAVKPPPVITVKEVVELISSSPEIRANLDLYYFALDHIRDKTSREIFISIPEDMRVWWIMKAYEKRAQ